MRPMTFWALVTALIFALMTVLWAFGDEPAGAVAVLATIMWWGSGVALIFFGLVAIGRWRREPTRRPAAGKPRS